MRLFTYIVALMALSIPAPALAQISQANLPVAASAAGRSVPCPIPGTAGSTQLCTPTQIVNSVPSIQINGASNNGPLNVMAAPNAPTVSYARNAGTPSPAYSTTADYFQGSREPGQGSGAGGVTAVTGNGSAMTYSFASNGAMTVGHTLVAAGFTPSVWNGSFTITASTPTSVTVTGTATGTPTAMGWVYDAATAGNGNGPVHDFQSLNSAGVVRDSLLLNGGLIIATAGAEQSDFDIDGYLNGSISVLTAVDASRPAYIPGLDNIWALGDIALGGANHSLQRWTYGYFTGGLCVGCSAAAPTSPYQAYLAPNLNNGVDIETSSGYIKLVGSFSNVAYNGIVRAGDSGLLYSGYGIFAPAMAGSGGLRGDSSGNMVETGNLTVTGAAIKGGSVPTLTGTCGTNTQIGGNTAGSWKFSAACTAGTVVITFASTAPNGWACRVNNMTTPADTLNQTAYTTTTATLTGTAANADQVTFLCEAF